MNLQPYRDIIRDVANAPDSVWHIISKDWYSSLLSEAEKLSTPNTCDTCKWWGVDSHDGSDSNIDFFYSSQGFKECGCSGSEGESGICIDGTEMGTMPVVVTGPRFGCIHHEPKGIQG